MGIKNYIEKSGKAALTRSAQADLNASVRVPPPSEAPGRYGSATSALAKAKAAAGHHPEIKKAYGFK